MSAMKSPGDESSAILPEEFDQIPNKFSLLQIHRLTIRDCDETVVGFASDQMLLKLKEVEIIYFDAA